MKSAHEPHILIDMPDFRMGGVQMVNTLIANHFVSLGWQVTMIGQPYGDPSEFGMDSRIKLVLTDMNIHTHMKKLMIFLRENHTDVYFSPLAMKPRIIPALLGVKHIIHLFHNTYEYNWREIAVEQLLQFRTQYISVSDAVRHHAAKKLSLPLKKIKTIYNSVNIDKFTPAKEAIPDEPLVVCSIGRLTYQKGFERLIQVAEKTIQRNLPIEYLIVGSGEDESALKAQAASIDPDGKWIKFLGKRLDTPELLRKSHLFASTLRYGGFEIVLAEAMATAIPPVAFEVGPVPEVIGLPETDCGILVEDGNIESFADQLQHLHENRDELRKRGENSRIRAVKFFSEDIQKKAFEDLVRGMLEGKK